MKSLTMLLAALPAVLCAGARPLFGLNANELSEIFDWTPGNAPAEKVVEEELAALRGQSALVKSVDAAEGVRDPEHW